MIESYLKGFEAFSRNGGASAPQWTRSLRLSGIASVHALNVRPTWTLMTGFQHSLDRL